MHHVRVLCGTLLLLAFLVAGCGENVKLVPVEGAVTVADKNLEKGNVAFHPDKAKGNDRTFAQPPVGTVANGKYTIATGGKPGAPAGWYKITVNASVPSNPKDEYSEPKLLIDKSYTDPATTPLAFEVKEGAAAGSYDLKLTN